MVEGPFDIAQTADAAKDMLDVFLGPLLRKPVEARIPEITQDATTVGGGCSVLHGNSILEDEEVRILKRKSSLRDKEEYLTSAADDLQPF
ncbi:unnamed protein product [Spirodela intermedia]|uniref:Uncharacterized protein n=1 Tax=Spirodela intermedia TaxID=51605 RepID=A0A7I8L1Q3_SPIIN|nr:unnamed protein product [Spirodela intermedia]